MYHVSREIEFCYGHRLLNYPGKCRHLHGHNGRLIISFAGDALDELGMVLDFGTIKQVVGRWIDENLDHKMILCRDDPLIPHLEELQEEFFVVDANPTAENIAKLVFDYAKQQGLPVISVQLWETPRCSATYGAYPSGSADG